MDAATHALLGALAAQAIPPRFDHAPLTRGRRLTVAAVAAAAPDLDYLGFWVDPYRFLTGWHRGLSHALPMVPLWTLVLSFGLAAAWGDSSRWRSFLAPCAVGLLSHVAIDLTTVFGMQALAPFSDSRIALGIVFDIDPWVTVIAAIGVAAMLVRGSAAIGGALLVLYLGCSAAMQQSAVTIAKRQAPTAHIEALPQPLSPFHWRLLIHRAGGYRVADLTLLGAGGRPVLPAGSRTAAMLAAYRSPQRLVWRTVSLFGESAESRALAREAWWQPGLADFRRFAERPVLYRIDRDRDGGLCVWFSDLRYWLPGLEAPFRYGLCRTGSAAPWRLYRLRRFSADDRQWLGR